MPTASISLVFMGTPEFAVPTLRALADSHLRPSLVITQPDRPSGRRRKLTPPPVKVVAQELGLPLLQPEDVNSPEAALAIQDLSPDFIVTAAYGGYLRRVLRKLPRLGCLNLHPSLLPRHRGAAPVNYTLFSGDIITGNTVYRMTARMDAGPIIYQSKTPMGDDECGTDLLHRLAQQGAKDVLHTLELLMCGKASPTSQDESLATFTKKIEKSDLPIDWSRTATEVRRQVRGLAETPGAVAMFRGAPLKIIACRELEGIASAEPGMVVEVRKNEGIVVACGGGRLLLERVQPAGKRIMDAWAFHLGAQVKPHETLRMTDAE